MKEVGMRLYFCNKILTMHYFFRFLLLVSFFIAPLSMFAQKKAKKTKSNYSTIGVNLDKIEMLEDTVMVIQVGPGVHTGGSAKVQFMRINGAESEPLDFDKLNFYFKKCPTARKELKLHLEYKAKMKKARNRAFIAGGGGFAAAIGLILLTDKPSSIPIGMGLGMAVGGVFAVKAIRNQIKSEPHLIQSFQNYHENCYATSAVQSDSAVSVASPQKDAFKIGSSRNDTVLYNADLIDPQNLRGFTFGIGAFVGLPAGGSTTGFTANTTYKLPRMDINFRGQYALVRSSSNSTNNDHLDYFWNTPAAISTRDVVNTEVEVLASVQLFGRIKTKSVEEFVESKQTEKDKAGSSVQYYTNLETKRLLSVHGRIGVMTSERLSEGEHLTVDDPVFFGNGYVSNGIFSMRSSQLIVGLGFRLTRNDKFTLLYKKKTRGSKKRFFGEVYFDLMPAFQAETADVLVGIGEPTSTNSYTSYKVNTPIDKTGYRLGYRVFRPGNIFVTLDITDQIGLENDFNGMIRLDVGYRFHRVR
jgi:hypothetical protein